MAMGTCKQREKQDDILIAHGELASAPAHPFYERLNELLEAEKFDEFVEGRCRKFYAAKIGRRSLTPGIYFRALLLGYFEGIDSERGIAWRLADSRALRWFVGIALDEKTPDHSTISRTRRLIDVETHREVFGWVLGRLADRGLLKGKRIAIDATTLEANAAMRSLVRRDTGESYEEFLAGLAKASGIATPTREELARLDRKRKKRMSNQEWKSPSDHLRGHKNILKRQLIHIGAFNLGLILRKLMGAGTPREWRNLGGVLLLLIYWLGWGQENRNRPLRRGLSRCRAKEIATQLFRLRRWPCRKSATYTTGC